MFVQSGFFLAILHLTLGYPTSEVRRYDGHKVFDVIHKVEEDFLKILALETKYELDFWKMPKHVDDKLTVMVAPQYLEDFLHELEAINADVTTVIEDVEQLLTEQKTDHRLHRRTSSSSSGLNLNQYHDYGYIQTHLESLVYDNLQGVNAELDPIGYSHEGRIVDMIKLSRPGSSASKKKIFIDGGIHAREWISPATVLYLIEMLAFNPDNSTDINFVLDNYDVLLAPVVNPDGYEYSRHSTRLWRKNRRLNSGSSCVGVDLNRNFPFEWNPATGGSTNPCSDLYSGSTAASEPETQNIVNYLVANNDTISAYLTIHSYGQMWLYPWGYTSDYPIDSDDLEIAARSATIMARKYFGTDYIVGPTTTTLYSAAGGSDDFAKGGANIKFSYTIELRDTGTHGFRLPERLIEPTAKEFILGFLAFVRRMTDIYNNA